MTKEEKQILKLADAHLRKLEAAGGNALKFAYARAQKDLQRLGISARMTKGGIGEVRRFDRRTGNDRTQKALINAARHFLQSQTSTPTAIKKLERKNLDRFNKKFGVNLNMKQYDAIADIFEDARFQGGSFKITQIIKAVERHDTEFLRSLNMIKDNNIDVFGVPESISSKNDLLDAVLDAMGEDLGEWKTSEILPL